MSKDRSYNLRNIEISREPKQSRSLLAQGVANDNGSPPAHQLPLFPHSSLSDALSNGLSGSPRNLNRVPFDDGETDRVEHMLSGHARTPSQEDGDWLEAEGDSSENESEIRSSAGQRVPFLTNVEAPSVMVAEDLHFDAGRLLDDPRPKSGLM